MDGGRAYWLNYTLDSSPWLLLHKDATTRIIFLRRDQRRNADDDMDLSASATRSVLLVEDDPDQRSLIAEYLAAHGYSTTAGSDLTSARQLLRDRHFSIILLDLALGAEDGTDFLRELGTGWSPPIIVISARAEEVDRIVALELGADDYLVKPFSLRELLAHIIAVLRRSRERRTGRRRRAAFGPWKVDLTIPAIVSAAGRIVELTGGEAVLLRVLLENPNRVLLRAELLAMTRRDETEVIERTIDVVVARLRGKIEEDTRRPRFIQAVRGQGYRLDADVTWSMEE